MGFSFRTIIFLTLALAARNVAAGDRDCSFTPSINLGVDRLIPQIDFAQLCNSTAKFTKLGNPCIAASVLSDKEMKKLFDQLAKVRGIPYDYPEDGCYARAMEMTRIMEREGVLSVKVIIEVPHTTVHDPKTGKTLLHSTDGKILYAKTANSPKGYVEWIWHIAPAVYAKKGDHLIPMIIDPSLFDHPVPVQEWVDLMTAQEHPKAKVSYNTRFRYGVTEKMDDCAQKDYLESDIVSMREVLKKYRYVADRRKSGEPVDPDQLKDEDFDK
jgi:hypothetical protein